MADRFGLAIVGAGLAATPHAQALAALKAKIDVRGVFTRSPKNRSAICAEYGFPQADDLDTLLNDPKVAAVLVLTPPDARQEITERAAAAGKHLLVEKPLERTLAAARGLVGICDRAGITLGVVFQHRFRPASIALRDILQGGTLGRICSLSLAVPWWRDQGYYDEPGRGTYARDGGGVLMTQAIHALDLMLSCTGPASEVQAICATTMHRMEAEDFAAAAVRFENGATGAIMATVTCYPGTEARLTLNCENATAILEGGRLDIFHHDGEHRAFAEPESDGSGGSLMDFPCDWHKSLIEDFVGAIRAGRPPASNGHSALNAHALIDAMTRSSASAKRERIT
ncbi:Gfo/Idh/MocA family oxidoreductase [Actibacterium sp. MT2.3-13A]|uniref:Gfo/Idh/MocA family protein n=1 Tax=Actibacterium sp. MT2.3-13A TaxID=2828332 RepID=UPI001BA87D94|nr:Gfo/Idh/MocA family oxidoreductase [Actibacterium sp. MT2.3-13A]